jgi:predicted Zn finger-like uncharacterized protein
MRIICPNCEAQYEVEDRLIPEGGRDVQCSNCGHTWFQYPHGIADPDEGDEADPPPPAPPAVAAPAAAVAAAPRPALDESLRAVLREEAEREAAARAAEARGRRSLVPVETQPDLGLDSAPSAAPPVSEPTPRPARREALPDIEAINSTLDAGATVLPPDPPPARGGGFVQGFAAVLLVAAVLSALYAFAPRIGAAIPAVAGPLGAYTSAVDAAHRALAAALRGG